MGQRIYIRLREEGVEVWRPAEAEHIREDLYRILGPVPEGELWEFEPGQVVHCRENVFSGGERGLVAYVPSSSRA